MREVELVTMDTYHEHQYRSLVRECRAIIEAGLASHMYFDAARIKWGLDHDSAQLAIYEAEGMFG
jgi:hypothetical protein